MSRKHFIAIATQIKAQVESIKQMEVDETSVASLATVRATADNLCDVFVDANPNFDRARFLTACGM